MTGFTKTDPAGRTIARLFARLGWGIFALGLGLAVLAGVLGRVPGLGGPAVEVSLLARVLAMLPGLGLAVFGLFSVMTAAQTRAALDSADIAREMLVLARRRPISLLAAVPPLGEEEPASRRAAPPRGSPVTKDQPASHATRSRLGTDGAADPAASPPRLAGATSPRAGQADTRDLRAEPVFAASPRPGPGKMHPIFSARPPR